MGNLNEDLNLLGPAKTINVGCFSGVVLLVAWFFLLFNNVVSCWMFGHVGKTAKLMRLLSGFFLKR